MTKNRLTILKSLTVLRQLSLHVGFVDDQHDDLPCAKLDALLEHLADVTGGGHRALVFSQFTGFLAKARARLDAAGIDYCYLDGKTRKRADVIQRFKAGGAPVFLISLKAGGFGLNLSEAAAARRQGRGCRWVAGHHRVAVACDERHRRVDRV